MSEKIKLIKNTIIISIGKISTQIITFLLLPLYTAKLSTAEYGIYDLLITISIFVLPIVTCLLEESMFRFLIDAQERKDKEKIITQTMMYLFFSTLIFSAIGIVIAIVTKYEYGVIFVIYMASSVLINTSNALARGTGSFKLYSITNLLAGVIIVALNLIFILKFNMGINSLFISTIIANCITFLIVFIKLKIYKYIKIKIINKKTLESMIKYSIPLIPNSISWSIIHVSDRIVITNVLGRNVNGIYAIAGKFPNILSAFYGYFSTAWKESASRVIEQKDKEKYYNEVLKSVKNIMSSVMLGIIAFMPILFSILVNKNYIQAYKYIPFLIISTYFNVIAEFYGGLFVAMKNTKVIGKTTLIGAIINILIDIILIKYIGIYAAVLSTLISSAYMMIKRKRVIKDYIKIKNERNILTYLATSIIILLYYINKTYSNIIMIMIAIVYTYIINKDLINSSITKIRNIIGEKKCKHS